MRMNISPKGKEKYSYLICGAGAWQQLISVGMVCSAFSAYLPYIASHFQYTHTETSLIITMRSLSILVSLVFIDNLITRLGARKVLFLSDVLAALGFVVFSRATKITDFCLGGILIGACNGLGGLATVSVVINKWFRTDKATALGISSAGSSIAMMAMPPLTTFFVETVGLRATFLLEAVFIALSSILIFFFVQDTPETVCAKPYGWDKETPMDVPAKAAMNKTHAALSPGKYILVLLSVAILGASGNVVSFLTMLYTSNGYSASMTALILSILGIVLIFGKVIFGRLTDKIGAFRSCTIISICLILGTAFSALSFTHSWLLLVAALLFNGFGWAMTSLGLTTMATMFASEKEHDLFAERFTLVYTVGFLAFSYVVGYLADKTGGYVVPFFACAVLGAISLLIRNWVYRRSAQQ